MYIYIRMSEFVRLWSDPKN